jgi:hypothetical protein
MAEPTSPSDAVNAIGARALTAAESVDLMNSALTGMFQTLRDKSETIGAITTSLGSLTLANTLYSSELYKTVIMGMEEAARVPRTIAAEIAGGNILAGTALNEQAKILFEDATRTQTALQTKMISFGFDATGQEIKRNATLLYKDSADLNKAYTDSVLRESALYSAGIKALNSANAYDMKESTDLAMRGLGLDAAAVRQIYEREYAHTGEITGKYIENFSATIIAGEKLTGLSKKALTEDVSRMLADFNMYGKYSESQMIVLSKTVHDLGIDLTTASASAQKFMSFEGATQAAANVTALTGVVIDSQKLFYLSNTDQSAYLLEQRKILRQMDFENFDIVKQNAIASELGFKNTEKALALRNSQLDSTGKVAADDIALFTKADENTGEALKEQLRKSSAIDTLRAMDPDEQIKTIGAVKNLAGGTEELGKAIETFNNRLIQTSAEVTPVMITAGKEVSNAFSVGLVKASDIISRLQAGTTEFFKSGAFAQVVTNFEAMMTGIRTAVIPILQSSMPPLWANVLGGMGLFKTEFDKILDSVDTSLSSTLDNMSKKVDQKGKIKADFNIETTESSSTAVIPAVAQPPTTAIPPASATTAASLPEAAPAPTGGPLAATAETTDMKIKLHFEIDGDKMNNMIDLRVHEILTGQITLIAPVGGYRPGGYRIKFVEAKT